MQDDVRDTAKLIDLVETVIDTDQLQQHHKVVIRPKYDKRLEKVAIRIQAAKVALDNEFEETSEALGFRVGDKKNPLNFDNHSTYGHCFRLTRSQSALIKGKKGYIELANKQNGCTFTTRKLKEADEEWKSASEQYERTQTGLAKEVVGIASEAGILLKLNALIATQAHMHIRLRVSTRPSLSSMCFAAWHTWQSTLRSRTSSPRLLQKARVIWS